MHHRGDRIGGWNDGEEIEVTEWTWMDGIETTEDGVVVGETEVEDGIVGAGTGEEVDATEVDAVADGGEAVVVAEVEDGEIGDEGQRV